MKKFQKYFLLLSLPLMACSTNRIAQEQQEVDNVYVSDAQAIEGTPYVKPYIPESERSQRTENNSNTEIYGDDRYDDREDDNRYGDGDYYDGMSYSTRIYRFHNYSPWRNYYDPYYDYRFDNYGYNRNYYDSFYFRSSPSWMFNVYVGPSYGAFYPYNYNPWGYYYSPYRYGNYWGIYSYYHTVPYYYGNYGGGNFYPGGYYGNSRINRPRPVRGSENTNPYYGNGNRGLGNGSRADRYGDSSPARSGGSMNTSARPSRSQNNGNTEQRRSNNSNTEPSRPARAERSSPPPSSSSSRKNDSSNESKPRPSRSGGR